MKSVVLTLIGAAGLWAQQQFDVVVPAPPVPPAPAAVGMPAMTANRTFMFVAGEMVGGQPVKASPYSAEAITENTQQLADGNKIVNRTTAMIYRDSEGRERREQSLPNIGPFAPQGAPRKTVFISDPVSKVNYSLDPEKHTAIKLLAPTAPPIPPMPPPAPGANTSNQEMNIMIQRVEGGVAGVASAQVTGAFPGPGAQMMFLQGATAGEGSSTKVEQLGSKLIEGVLATGTRTTMTIPAGQMGNEKPIEISDERWYAQELQATVYSEHSDPRTGKNLYSLKNISRSEPSPTLFQVPPDYTVTEPAANFQKFERKSAP